jgi:hypothetical protein
MSLNRTSPHGRWPRNSASINETEGSAAETAASTGTSSLGGCGGCDMAGCEQLPAGGKKELPMRHSFPGKSSVAAKHFSGAACAL